MRLRQIRCRKTAARDSRFLAECRLSGCPPAYPDAISRQHGEHCEFSVRDSDVSLPDVALEVRDDIVDKQACPKLSVNLNEHLRNVAFDKLVQQDNPRPVLHEEAALISEIGPFKTFGSCRRKVSPHEFVDATCVHLALG